MHAHVEIRGDLHGNLHDCSADDAAASDSDVHDLVDAVVPDRFWEERSSLLDLHCAGGVADIAVLLQRDDHAHDVGVVNIVDWDALALLDPCGANKNDFQKRRTMSLQELQAIAEQRDKRCTVFPSLILDIPPCLSPLNAIEQHGPILSTMRRPSGWDLAATDNENLDVGTAVLADTDIGCIPGCSIGIVAERLENYSYQVVFDNGGCVIVPLEAFCIAGKIQHNVYDSDLDDDYMSEGICSQGLIIHHKRNKEKEHILPIEYAPDNGELGVGEGIATHVPALPSASALDLRGNFGL